MARPLSGHKKLRDGVWMASVPSRRGATARVSACFDTEAEADVWLGEQVERVTSGLEAQRPAKGTRRGRRDARNDTAVAAVASPAEAARTFEEYAHAWHHEYYVLLQRGGPGRARDVMSDLRLHILPHFGGPLETDVARGRSQVISWTRKMAGYGAAPGDAVEENAPTYATDNVSGMLWIISEVLLYAHTLGAPVAVVASTKGGVRPAITNGVSAMKPRNRVKRKARLVTFEETRELAGEMHVIHQTALWLMRVAGLRIGEVYGLINANFINDAEWGYLVIEAQGGQTHLVRDENELVVPATRVATLKTAAGYRVIALPHSLTALLRHVIDIFGTDPHTGKVDATKRLIPGIRSEEGGAAGFRNALRRASGEVGGALGEDDLIIPHDMRKGFATDLAWTPGLEAILKRRALGHRAGSDVYDLIYSLDDRLLEAMKPAAEVIDAEIANSIGSLLVPTTKRPSYGSSLDPSIRAARDASLVEIGWQLSTLEDGWIGVEEAAAVLSMSATATRRLVPDQIAGVKHDGEWHLRLEDVVAYRERFEGLWDVEAIAEKVGASYDQVHATLRRLDISPLVDQYTRRVHLTSEQTDAVVDEFARIDALHLRSLSVAQVARTLRASHSSIHMWLESGLLLADDETDASGKKYVTRLSVQSELTRRGMKRREVVSAAELKEYSGLDDRATRALVDRGVLTRGPKGGYTADSVQRWMLGYRPDLLDTDLICFE